MYPKLRKRKSGEWSRKWPTKAGCYLVRWFEGFEVFHSVVQCYANCARIKYSTNGSKKVGGLVLKEENKNLRWKNLWYYL